MSELLAGRSPLSPADYIEATRSLYSSLGYDPYRWAERPDTPPFTPFAKPLSDCKVALVGSGGVYRAGQIAFGTRDDTSIRVIPSDTQVTELRTAHFAYDQHDARRDPNVVFPLTPLAELSAAGVIGTVAANAYAFMGGIYSTRRVEQEVVPLLTEQLLADEVDLVLLVPV
ncbi:MAG: glycine/sarcosine/betaine reductase selenoprotein B family protein [Acidimicrobiales bacterium]